MLEVADAAPHTPFNVEIGPHRRVAFVRRDLGDFKRVKNAHGGTVNDVVLSVVAGALGNYLRARGHDTEDLELRAMVPVSVRAGEEHGALGNRISAMMAPLPVWLPGSDRALAPGQREDGRPEGFGPGGWGGDPDPADRLRTANDRLQAARLQPAQRFFNLVVTNVPGPQFPLYLLGRRMESIYPLVPLARRQALCIGIMSYDGRSISAWSATTTRWPISTASPSTSRARSGKSSTRRSRGGETQRSDPGADPERRGVGQVVPVEPAGVEALGSGVGVDHDRGDPLEAPGAAQPHRHRARRAAGSAGGRHMPVALAADPAHQGQPAATPRGASARATTARPPAGVHSQKLEGGVVERALQRRHRAAGCPRAAYRGSGRLRGSGCRCATRRRRGRSGRSRG